LTRRDGIRCRRLASESRQRSRIALRDLRRRAPCAG
jgi:hypothetical protein